MVYWINGIIVSYLILMDKIYVKRICWVCSKNFTLYNINYSLCFSGSFMCLPVNVGVQDIISL
jgi:hypothetical protein